VNYRTIIAALVTSVALAACSNPAQSSYPPGASQDRVHIASAAAEPDRAGGKLLNLHPKSLTFTSASSPAQDAYVEHDNGFPWNDTCQGIAEVGENGHIKRAHHVMTITVAPEAPGQCTVTFSKRTQRRILHVTVDG